MNQFEFELGQNVALKLSDERGTVIGRAEYANFPNSFNVRYLAADGGQREGWFEADALRPAA